MSGSDPSTSPVLCFAFRGNEILIVDEDGGGRIPGIDRIAANPMVSPFGPGLRYSVYSAFTILPAHQHRHLQQAERAWQTVSGR